jgi:NAD(P)-dependent dehydrogenase (short-subunit alcohol dehydrogenase family)
MSTVQSPKFDPAAFTGLHQLQGKVAYVPGGSGGLGEAIAWGLASIGARVVVGGVEADKTAQVAAALRAQGHDAQSVVFDATSVADIGRSVDAVHDFYGACDIMVNCVGIFREESILEVTEKIYDQVLAVNLKSGMFLGQAVARRQIAAKNGGRHVHLLSVRSLLGLRGKGYSAYCSSKGGLLMLVRQHASELAPHGINVNGIAPTFVMTEMIGHVLDDPEFQKNVLGRIPLGRIAEPKDVVGPVQFFCTKASEFVTGQVLFVDGGLTACQ